MRSTTKRTYLPAGVGDTSHRSDIPTGDPVGVFFLFLLPLVPVRMAAMKSNVIVLSYMIRLYLSKQFDQWRLKVWYKNRDLLYKERGASYRILLVGVVALAAIILINLFW